MAIQETFDTRVQRLLEWTPRDHRHCPNGHQVSTYYERCGRCRKRIDLAQVCTEAHTPDWVLLEDLAHLARAYPEHHERIGRLYAEIAAIAAIAVKVGE